MAIVCGQQRGSLTKEQKDQDSEVRIEKVMEDAKKSYSIANHVYYLTPSFAQCANINLLIDIDDRSFLNSKLAI
jgi:hypothetical protein